jgi:nucleoside-diphosphate-sugar epimerase
MSAAKMQARSQAARRLSRHRMRFVNSRYKICSRTTASTTVCPLRGAAFFPPFDPYEHLDWLVPSVVQNLLLGREAPCSHGRQVRNFLHVADLGDEFVALLDSALEEAGQRRLG